VKPDKNCLDPESAEAEVETSAGTTDSKVEVKSAGLGISAVAAAESATRHHFEGGKTVHAATVMTTAVMVSGRATGEKTAVTESAAISAAISAGESVAELPGESAAVEISDIIAHRDVLTDVLTNNNGSRFQRRHGQDKSRREHQPTKRTSESFHFLLLQLKQLQHTLFTGPTFPLQLVLPSKALLEVG
jgi:hypothetical protein